MTQVPEVRLYVSPLIVDSDGRLLVEGLREKVNEYRIEWKKTEALVLTALTEKLGISFYLETIDVYIADKQRSISMPLIMRLYENSQEFVDVLIHELCHNLLCDNSVMSIKNPNNPYSLTKIWTELFGEHSTITRNHIPVQALMKYIYLDVLNDKMRYERDLRRSKGKVGYEDSWEYVNKHGYQEIVEKMRQSYDAMREKE